VEENTLEPYDMLFGALGSCYYSTFLDVAKKKRINFDHAEIHIEGVKRDTPPTTLEWVKVKLDVKNSSNNLGLEKAAALAAKYCSVYVTISKVADISWEINFI
jgi:putative redox protein